MINTEHGLIYSPRLPEEYTRNGHGPGAWVKGEIAKWNIAWLSMPDLDLYLYPELDYEDIMGKIDPVKFGSVVALAGEGVTIDLPGLRKALTQPPALCKVFLTNFGMRDLPTAELYPDWVSTVYRRLDSLISGVSKTVEHLIHSEVKQAAIDAEAHMANVIHHDFRKRRDKT